jgi:formylglycine-generating enzyme required for sulfatase activity
MAILSLPIGITLILVFLYFLPSFIAGLNHKTNVWAIFAFNLLLGWTFIGWVVSLVWALTKDKKENLAIPAINVVTRVDDRHMSERRSLNDRSDEDLRGAFQPPQPPSLPVQNKTTVCQSCKFEIPADATKCGHCGDPQPGEWGARIIGDSALAQNDSSKNKTRICKACKFEIAADADKCGYCRAAQPRLVWRLSILTLIFTALCGFWWYLSATSLPDRNQLAKDADKANTTLSDQSNKPNTALADQTNYAPTTPVPGEERLAPSNPESQLDQLKPELQQTVPRVNAKDGLKYMWIPPGTFTMGCSEGDAECMDSEKPAHQVSITKGFWLGQTEVTQAAFQHVMDRNPSAEKGAILPVENVSWTDAAGYCRAIGGRLPTEAEWEYAARGGSNLPRYGGLDQVAWYARNSDNKTTHHVGQKQPNGYGLNDMLGNVSEWTADWFGTYPTGAVSDPQGPTVGQKRVLRGGSFADLPGTVRASLRGWDDPGTHYANYGFRCVEESQ